MTAAALFAARPLSGTCQGLQHIDGAKHMGTPNDVQQTVSTRRTLSRKAASRRRRTLARPVARAARAAEFEMLETRQLLTGAAPTLTSVNTIPNATEDTAFTIS